MSRTDGAVVICPECMAKFGGMLSCPWCGVDLVPLPDIDETAMAFYMELLAAEGQQDE